MFLIIKLRLKYLFMKLSRFLNSVSKNRLTFMIIPHSEKKSLRFNISHAVINLFLFLSLTAALSGSVYMIHFSIKVKELSRLKHYKDSALFRENIFLKEIQNYQKTFSSFKKNYLNFLSLTSDVPNAIGGREIPLKDLTEDLKNYLKKEKKLTNTGDRPDKLYAKLYNDIQFMQNSAQTAKQLNVFFNQRKRFFKAFATIRPVNSNEAPMIRKSKNSIVFETLPGTDVKSVADGNIHSIETASDGCLIITIDHGFGVITRYNGILSTKLKKHDSVRKGEAIGYAGQKIIYKLRLASTWMDPLLFFMDHVI